MSIKHIVKDLNSSMNEIVEISDSFMTSHIEVQAVPSVLLENIQDSCQGIVDNYESYGNIFQEAKEILLLIPEKESQITVIQTIALRTMFLRISKMYEHTFN